MISCDEAVRQLWAQVEAAIGPVDAALLDAHLALCRRCCGEAGFAHELRVFLRRHAQPTVPPDVAVRLAAMIAELEETP